MKKNIQFFRAILLIISIAFLSCKSDQQRHEDQVQQSLPENMKVLKDLPSGKPTIQCDVCKGTGKTKCPYCDGSGRRMLTKTLDDGTTIDDKVVDCVECNGFGTVECRTCGGSGKIESNSGSVSKAETKYFKASYFNSKVTGQDWVGWKESDVSVTIDNFIRHIEIYSATQQSINYSPLKRVMFIGYSLYTSKGVDSNNQSINVIFKKLSNGTFYLTIEYSDIQYSYNLIENDQK